MNQNSAANWTIRNSDRNRSCPRSAAVLAKYFGKYVPKCCRAWGGAKCVVWVFGTTWPWNVDQGVVTYPAIQE